MQSNEGLAYAVRIEACKATRETLTEPSPRQRLGALDDVLSHLAARAHAAWLAADVKVGAHAAAATATATAAVTATATATTAVTCARSTATRRTLLFDATVQLLGTCIHLHRRAWFADLSLDLHSCSFQSEHMAGGGPDAALVERSVARIALVAHRMSGLLLADFEACYAAEAVAPPHWPFIACCNMLASYGCVIALLNAKADERRGLRGRIDFLEASLSLYARFWPVAAKAQHEVRACLRAVEAST